MRALVRSFLFALLAVSALGHSLGPNDVVFHLWSRRNPQQSQVLFPTVSSVLVSAFDVTERTIVTFHGLGDFANFNAFVVNAHLEAEAVNVIAVDWSAGSNTYSEGVSQANQAGLIVSQFLNFLESQFTYQASNLRFVGVGLGAHVAAITARLVNGVVPHLIAIDPSLHGWTHHSGRVGPDAANVVEVLHATAGFLGYDFPLGDLDFYPNGGSHQNGCGIDISCSHIFAIAFYAESVTAPIREGNEFIGTGCASYEQAIAMECTGARDATFGGPNVKNTGNGIYTFRTDSSSPFALGLLG